MVVGVLRLVLYLPDNRSLKEKRGVVRSIKQRVSNKFNVSVAECEDHDDWKRITLGIVQVGNDRTHVDRSLRRVSAFVETLSLAQTGEESYHFDNY